MKITPIGKKILIKGTSNKEKLSNGLEIGRTVTSRRDIHSGTVMALGTGLDQKNPVVNVGDLVFFPSYAAQSIAVDGQDYLVIMVNDIDLVASDKIEGGL